MRPCLPPGRMCPTNRAASSRVANSTPRPFVRLDNARQLEVEIMLLGLRHGPILRHRNSNERYHTQTPNGRNVPFADSAPNVERPAVAIASVGSRGITYSITSLA